MDSFALEGPHTDTEVSAGFLTDASGLETLHIGVAVES
jgi:hypothetical protein